MSNDTAAVTNQYLQEALPATKMAGFLSCSRVTRNLLPFRGLNPKRDPRVQ